MVLQLVLQELPDHPRQLGVLGQEGHHVGGEAVPGHLHLPLGVVQLLPAPVHLPPAADDAGLLGLQLGGGQAGLGGVQLQHQLVQAAAGLDDGGELRLGEELQLLDDVLHLDLVLDQVVAQGGADPARLQQDLAQAGGAGLLAENSALGREGSLRGSEIDRLVLRSYS